MEYSLCQPAYLLIPFRNNDSSSHNQFRLYLDCPDARIVTDQQEYEAAVEREVMERMNFIKMEDLWDADNHTAPTHYECTLHFNQEIGIMLRVTLEEEAAHPSRSLTLRITRNTLPVATIPIKMKYQPPILWDSFEHYHMLTPSPQQLVELG